MLQFFLETDSSMGSNHPEEKQESKAVVDELWKETREIGQFRWSNSIDFVITATSCTRNAVFAQ